MTTFGFEECKVTNLVFIHRARDLRVVAHVDDILVSGEYQDMAWFRDEMPITYELKAQVAGWEQGNERELSSLGRTITTTTFGVEPEGYEKHVKKLEEEWGMDTWNPRGHPIRGILWFVQSIVGSR